MLGRVSTLAADTLYAIMAGVGEPYHVIQNLDAARWDAFVHSRGGHLLQSAAWGQLKAHFGWEASSLALERGGRLLGGAQLLYRRLPMGLRLAYVPRGPVANPADRETLAALVDALRGAARARGAFALKLEPDWLADNSLADWLVGRGLRPSAPVQPRTTIWLDLTCSLEELLAQMRQKWRYNIRLAARKGVTVRLGSVDDVPLFHRLLQVTGARDGFAIHTLEYYRTAFQLLAPDQASLFVAEYDGEPLAAIFVTAFGHEAVYLYGASGNAHRERMPNHALHWKAVQWAKARGCTRYDLWGIAESKSAREAEGDAPGPSGPVLPEGLYKFKQGFGGRVARYIGAYDAVFSPARYMLYKRALALRRGGLT